MTRTLTGETNFISAWDRDYFPLTASAPVDRVIIPSSFSGSFADQAKKLTEAMAILRHHGPPSYFVTFTCNSDWTEIGDRLHHGQTAFNRAELCARVFKQKLDVLLQMLPHVFGPIKYRIAVIEFQKRGLPHSHIIFQVADDVKPDNAQCIDEHIRATWPNKDQEPELYAIVDKFMTHKNCERRPCYQEGKKKCKKRFPKPPQLSTTFDDRGYPLYRRTSDDRDIVPYTPTLLLAFDAHINTEVSASVNVVSYVFGYIYKGPDRTSFAITEVSEDTVDTIKQWKYRLKRRSELTYDDIVEGPYVREGEQRYEAFWRKLGLAAVDSATSSLEGMEAFTCVECKLREGAAGTEFESAGTPLASCGEVAMSDTSPPQQDAKPAPSPQPAPSSASTPMELEPIDYDTLPPLYKLIMPDTAWDAMHPSDQHASTASMDKATARLTKSRAATEDANRAIVDLDAARLAALAAVNADFDTQLAQLSDRAAQLLASGRVHEADVQETDAAAAVAAETLFAFVNPEGAKAAKKAKKKSRGFKPSSPAAAVVKPEKTIKEECDDSDTDRDVFDPCSADLQPPTSFVATGARHVRIAATDTAFLRVPLDFLASSYQWSYREDFRLSILDQAARMRSLIPPAFREGATLTTAVQTLHDLLQEGKQRDTITSTSSALATLLGTLREAHANRLMDADWTTVRRTCKPTKTRDRRHSTTAASSTSSWGGRTSSSSRSGQHPASRDGRRDRDHDSHRQRDRSPRHHTPRERQHGSTTSARTAGATRQRDQSGSGRDSRASGSTRKSRRHQRAPVAGDERRRHHSQDSVDSQGFSRAEPGKISAAMEAASRAARRKANKADPDSRHNRQKAARADRKEKQRAAKNAAIDGSSDDSSSGSSSSSSSNALGTMIASGAVTDKYITTSAERCWGGFGSAKPLTTSKMVRLTVQFYHENEPTASLAVWAHVAPAGSMDNPLLLGRDSYMRFTNRGYRKLPTPPGRHHRVKGEYTFNHHDPRGAEAYITDPAAQADQFQLRYSGNIGVSLSDTHQLLEVNLVRADGAPALRGQYLVEMDPNMTPTEEVFVSNGRQSIPVAGCAEIEPGTILGYASAPLLRVPLDSVEEDPVSAPHHSSVPGPVIPGDDVAHEPGAPPATCEDPFVHAVSGAAASPSRPSPPKPPPTKGPTTPPAALLTRLTDQQRDSFVKLWDKIPPHLRAITFDLHGEGWTPDVIDNLATVLCDYQDVFSKSPTDLGSCPLLPFKIAVPPDSPPVRTKPYRMNPIVAKQVDVILDKYLAAGLIQHSTSPYCSPIVVVPKKSGGLRIAINYQRLNKVSVLSQLPVPRVDEILTKLNKGNIFSLFDFTGSFHQIPVHPDTIPLTAFATQSRLFEWLRMPMGASQSAGHFVKVINEVIKGLEGVEAYLDDVVVFDETPAQHVQSMRRFLHRLRTHNLKLSPPKATVGTTHAAFLGHTITPDGVSPNPDKVAALAKMPMPTDLKQLRSLLGGLSYYRSFIKDMAKRTKALNDLLKKGTTFAFTDSMEATVRELLAELSRPPVLVFPDWEAIEDQSRPFRLHTDASVDGLGATLEQEQPDGTIRPIVFISRATLDAERNWTALDLEAGAVVWAIKRLRAYLRGTQFRIFTDSSALENMAKIADHNPPVKSERHIRHHHASCRRVPPQ
eukprot:g11082.t1